MFVIWKLDRSFISFITAFFSSSSRKNKAWLLTHLPVCVIKTKELGMCLCMLGLAAHQLNNPTRGVPCCGHKLFICVFVVRGCWGVYMSTPAGSGALTIQVMQVSVITEDSYGYNDSSINRDLFSLVTLVLFSELYASVCEGHWGHSCLIRLDLYMAYIYILFIYFFYWNNGIYLHDTDSDI